MRAPRRLMSPFLLALAATGITTPTLAQLQRPQDASRIVREWDFEPVDGILVPVPEHWFRGHTTPQNPRPGFPPWNEAVLADEVGVDGSWAVRIPTEGGSASLTLARGVVPVFGDSDYAITAMVRTQDLDYAGAVLVARFIDGGLATIPGSEIRSRLIRTDPDADDPWTRVQLVLDGEPTAQSVQIELMLIQPDSQPGFQRSPHEAVTQDLTGAVIVDDIVVYQTPRIAMHVNGRGNIVVNPETPELTMRVRDLAGEALSLRSTIYAFDGREVDVHTREANSGGQDMLWRPDLASFGWYRAVMEIRNPNGLIGRAYLDFVWTPDDDHARAEFATEPGDRRRFGITLATRPQGSPDPDDPAGGALLPHMLREAHTGALVMPAWVPAQRPAPTDPAAFGRMIETILEQGHELAFVLDELPVGVANEYRVDRSSLLNVLLDANGPWVRSVSDLLSRYGERVRTWQIGADGSSDAYYRDDIAQIVGSVRDSFEGRVPKPDIRVPWRAELSTGAIDGVADSKSLYLPSSVRASEIDEYASVWANAPETTVVVELPDNDRFSPRDRVIELVRRLTLARASGAERLVVREPWVPIITSGHSAEANMADGLMPTPEFAALRTLSDALANREIVGELDDVPGVRVFIAQGETNSMLIAWREDADPADAAVTGYLGEDEIIVRDPFGNATASVPDEGRHRIGLGEMPVFVENIDVNLARFRAGMRLDPKFIQSEARRHYVNLVLTNPWEVSINGRVRFKEPEAWKMTPRVLNFTLGPGETKEHELSLVLGGGEEAGPRQVVTEVELIALRQYPIFDVPIQVEVGLKDIELRVSYRFVENEAGELAHVVVTAVVTNVSDRPATLRAVAIAPGQASQHRAISSLPGGETVVRTFRFDNAVEALKGQTIRVGLREQNGPGRLNRSLQMPD